MTRLQADWLSSEPSQKIAKAFTEAGHQIFFVGGCVRNTLLGREVSDIDMATDALPDKMIEIGREAGLKTIPTGIDHGTITMIAGGIHYEITTFRHDTQTDGRHAQVVFSDNKTDDAVRRDFTMNALYAGPDGALHDPVNGLPDLQARRVRFVGNPTDRITEDYLRILRFFRFHAWYGDPAGGLDADGLAACAEGISGLDGLSRERVGAEMIKLLSAPDPTPAIAAMAQSGVLNAVLPGADPKALGPLVHFEGDTPPDWRRRASVLGGQDIGTLWRLSKKDTWHLEKVHDLTGETASVAEIAYRHDGAVALNTGLSRAALFETPHAADLEREIAKGEAAEFPIKAADLPVLQGRALGEKLRELEDAWIASGFEISKDALLSL